MHGNHLESRLSGGLVYGHEVPRPSWYQSQRKRAFHPLARRKPSRRREQVREMLPRGIGVTEIARRLGI